MIPLLNYILIEQLGNEERKTKGGIVIPIKPESAIEKQFEGTIVAIGPLVKDRTFQIGVKVAINPYGACIRRKQGKKEFVIIRDSEIVAILDESDSDASVLAEMDGPQNYKP